jgi:DNA-directed RNA polymerase specialized sigma24 family protein
VTNTTPERRDQVGAFFAANADRLQRAVRCTARAPEQTIEDARQAAWIILLRHPEITLDRRGVSWLLTVATYEAWRLASNRYETLAGSSRVGATDHDAEQLPEPADPDDRSAEQRALARIEHDERVDAVETLKPREREALYLKGLGYSYHEIAKLSWVGPRQCRCVGVLGRRRHVADGSAAGRVGRPRRSPRAAARRPVWCC